MGRTLAAESSITRPISSHRARGKPKRRRSTRTIPILVRQARTTASATTLQRPAMTVQPQSPSDYRQSSERGRARACVLRPKTDRRDENCHAGNPTTTALRHYILCLEAVRRHRSRQALDIIEGNWRTSNRSFDSWSRRRASAETRRGSGNRNVVPGPGPLCAT